MADGEVRPLFLGIAAGNGLKWNEAKGRVKGGSLFVQTPNGEQGMDLSGARVEFLDLDNPSSGPEWCFTLHLPKGVSLPMGAPNDLLREFWVENLAKGIETANNGGDAVEASAETSNAIAEFEILEDSSEEEEEEEKGNMDSEGDSAPPKKVTGKESVSVGGKKKADQAATKSGGAPPVKKPVAGVGGVGGGGETKVEADEAGVIGVVCEAVELAIERECSTEDDAVKVLRNHLGANEDGSLDRAVQLWCRRFSVDLPQPMNPNTTVLAVVAKWIFWVIQARTLLRARFNGGSEAKKKKEAGEGDPLEDMVLGEWAGELGLGLEDLEALHADPATRDEVTRDLAFWFAGKANEEQQGGGGQSSSSSSSTGSMVVKKKNKNGDDGQQGSSSSSLNRSLASLASEKRKAALAGSKTSVALRASARAASHQQAGKGGPGKDGAPLPLPQGDGAHHATQAIRSNAAQAGAGAASNAPPGGLVALEELSAAQRAALFMGMSPDEKAEVVLDLTPLERQPLLAALGKSDTAELLAMDDVVMTLSADELVTAGVGETSLSQRALALTRLSVDAKFKLFTLEGRQEALEIEEAKRATVGYREGASARPSDRAINVVIAARVSLYHLMDHKSRVECLGHFTDRMERADLLKALSADDRQELIDACLAAEMAGHRDWFNGWDWFDWFDFSGLAVGGDGMLGGDSDDEENGDGSVTDPVAAARRIANSATLGAYADLVGQKEAGKGEEAAAAAAVAKKAAEAEEARRARMQAEGATLDEDTFSAEGPPAPLGGATGPKSSTSSHQPQGAFMDDFMGPGLMFLGSAQKSLVDAAQQAQEAASGEAAAAGGGGAGMEAGGGGNKRQPPSATKSPQPVSAAAMGVEREDEYNLPQAVAKEQERLQRRDGRLREVEDGLRRIAVGDAQLQELLVVWRGHKERERKALASLAVIQRQQADAARESLGEKATNAGRGKGSAADNMNAAQKTRAEAEAVRSSQALEAQVEEAKGSAEAAEVAMKEARRLLLPSAHDRTDLAVLAQRVSVSYFSEVEMVKTQLAQEEGQRKLRRAQGAIEDAKAARAAGKLPSSPSSSSGAAMSDGDLATLEFDAAEDLKLRIFTLELENARIVSEAAGLRRTLSEMNRNNSSNNSAAPQAGEGGGLSSGGGGGAGAQPDDSDGGGGGELARLRSELVSTRLQVSVLSESIASTQAESAQSGQRAKAAELEAAKRKQLYESHGADFAALMEKYTQATKELAWVRSCLEGTVAAKDRADAKLHASEARLSTVAQLDPHRWHAGRQNVRLETELRAAREDRDRSVSRANKDVAHFKAEIALAADKLERAESQLSSAVKASSEAQEAHEAEASDLEQRLLAMQALLDTANGRLDEQLRSFDELSKSHAQLEASARAGAERLALYERRASLADESLGDARQQLVALTKTHELMKAAEARRVATFTKEKAALEEARNEASVLAGRLQGQLTEARGAGEAVAKGLEASQQRVGLLEQDMGALLEQEADMRAALSETKGVLLKVTADYKQRMTEAAAVARELRAAEQELVNRSEQLRVSEVAAQVLRSEMGSAHEKAAQGAGRALTMQKHMVAREEEIAAAAAALMTLAIDIEKPIAEQAVGDEDDEDDDIGGEGNGDGEGRGAQLRRMVELQRKIANLTAPTASVLAGAAANKQLDSSSSGNTSSSPGQEGGGEDNDDDVLPTYDNLKAELEAAQQARDALDNLAAKHLANLSGNSNKSAAATAADEAGGNEEGGEGSGGGGGEEESVVFSDAVLMTETERILGLIDSVEARGTSVSMPRPPGSQAEEEEEDDGGDAAA